jgi:hypothetical protein
VREVARAASRSASSTSPTRHHRGLAHTQLLPGDGWSAAAQDHLAFTFSPERGILAIPYSRYDGEYRSSLVVVGVDAASGFTPRGEIDHARFAFDGCPNEPEPKPSPEPVPGAEDLACPILPEMRRGYSSRTTCTR